jgi:hypothetical protein
VSGAAEQNSNLFAEVSAVDARIEHPLHRRAMPRLRTLAQPIRVDAEVDA